MEEANKIDAAIKALKKGAERTTKVAYYENGKKACVERYKNGVKDGRWTEWDDGKKKSEVQYKDGEEVSRKEF